MQGMDKTGKAKGKVGKIIESPHTDPTGKMKLKKPGNAMDWMSDRELKPNKSGGGTRSY